MSANRRRSTGSPTGLARKEVIVRAAAKVFAEKGFSQATVRDIADEASMLSGSLYYYFNSKEAMVEEVLSVYLEDMVTGYQEVVAEAATPVAALEGLVKVALNGLLKHRAELKILQNDWHYVRPLEGIAKRQRQVESVWIETIEAGAKAGAIRSDIDARMVYRTIMGAIQAVIRWFDPRGKVSVDDVIAVQTSILLDGVRTPS